MFYVVSSCLLLALFSVSRWFMFKGFRQCSFEAPLRLRCSFVGGVREWMLFSGAYIFCYSLKISKDFVSTGLMASIAMVVCIDIIIFLTILDMVIFIRASRRFDKSVYGNTNWISIKSMLNINDFSLLIFITLFLSGIGYAVFKLFNNVDIKDAWTLILAVVAVCAAHVYIKDKKVIKEDFESKLHYSSSWINHKISMFIAEDVNIIMDSALLSFLQVFIKKGTYAHFKNTDLEPEEKQILEKLGLAQGKTKKLAFDPKLYSRIIVIPIECLARQYLPYYNPKIPKETTPFLSYISRKFHRLDNYYASSSPTELALTSLLASRLRNTWELEDTSQETLFSVLRKLDYVTYFLQCTTGHYNNHHKKVPVVFKAENFIADEVLAKDFPNATHNDWGVCDAVLYQKSLQILNKNKKNKICMVIAPVDTHVPYWFSYTKFPQAIEATQSRVLRSLYQMDCELATFFTNLRTLHLFDDDTLLIITGDHNPHFGPEYNELTGATSYYPNMLPLVFVTAQHGPFNAIPSNTLGCHLDILPTLCEGLGLSVPETALGTSLFSVPEQRFIMQQQHPTRVEVSSYVAQVSIDCTVQAKNAQERALQKWLAAKMQHASAL